MRPNRFKITVLVPEPGKGQLTMKAIRTSRETKFLIAALLLSALYQFGIDAPLAGAEVRTPDTGQTTGVPGSASATTTIDGKQIPPPDPKFGGMIKDNALQSKAWWAPRVVPPKKAPNVLLI